MTREEAVNILKQVISWRHDNLRGHHEMKYVAEAIELIMSPFLSLPSGLDEAAEEIVRDWLAYGDGEYKKLVIAGAEWMAGQFQKIEGEPVDWYSTSEGKDYCCGVKTIDAFEVPEGFYIRKK